MRPALLDDLERSLAAGLRHDARRAGWPEATARVLLALRPGEEVPMGEVARRIGRDASTATRFVDRAALARLVRRSTGADRRRRLAHLTEEGEAAREALLSLRAARAERVAHAVRERIGLSDDQIEWFAEALVRSLERR